MSIDTQLEIYLSKERKSIFIEQPACQIYSQCCDSTLLKFLSFLPVTNRKKKKCCCRKKRRLTHIVVCGKCTWISGSSVTVTCPKGTKVRLSDNIFKPDFKSYTGEGNGKLLQCPHLENPVDRGACWAAVRGVAKSRA